MTMDMRKWAAHPRRHWCLQCVSPVRRITNVERVMRGCIVTVWCHGERASKHIPDTYAEDNPKTTVRWFDETTEGE